MFRKKQEESTSRAINLVTMLKKHTPTSEQYRTIRSNIHFSMVDQPLKSLMVASAGPGEGKSMVSSNLAVVYANTGKKILLVDADMRKPSLSETFDLANDKGLSDLLVEKKPFTSYVHPSGVENLDVLTSGSTPPNPSELLGSKRMEEVMTELEEAYDLVIVDVPPLMAVSDAQVVGTVTDGTIFVIRERLTDNSAAIRAHELLKMAKVNVIGTIYNGTTAKKNYGYDAYYQTTEATKG